jgi:hypothetical protein
VSSRDLSIQKQNPELEGALTQVGTATGDPSFGRGDQDAGASVRKRHRTRAKWASFQTGDGGDDDKDQDWIVVQTTIASRIGLEAVSPELGSGKVCLVYEVLSHADPLSEKGACASAKIFVEENVAGARIVVENNMLAAARSVSRDRGWTNDREKGCLGHEVVVTNDGGEDASINGIAQGVEARVIHCSQSHTDRSRRLPQRTHCVIWKRRSGEKG